MAVLHLAAVVVAAAEHDDDDGDRDHDRYVEANEINYVIMFEGVDEQEYEREEQEQAGGTSSSSSSMACARRPNEISHRCGTLKTCASNFKQAPCASLRGHRLAALASKRQCHLCCRLRSCCCVGLLCWKLQL